MQYRKLGKLGNDVSALGFGCMRLPTQKKLFWRTVNIPEAIKILRYGIDHGINYIDTAYGYHGGKSEVIVGQALQNGYRQKVCLVTKAPMWRIRTAADIEKYLDIQLKRLQTDHLDIYLFHGLNKGRIKLLKEQNLIKKMEELKAKGKIKAIGFSFHDDYQTFKNLIDLYNWDACLVQHNYMDTNNQATSEGLKYAASKGVAVIIMEPLRGGRLANPTPEVKALMDSNPVKRSPVDWALQFLWNKPEISCVISGMSNLEQVKQNIESANNSKIGLLSASENATLENIADIFRKLILIPCSNCEYCLPCPQGVRIPQNFSMINNLHESKNLKKAQKAYKMLLKQNGAPQACTKCEACIEKCPQNIKIPTILEKIRLVMEEGKTISDVF